MAKAKKNNLSYEDRYKMLMTPCKTRKQLQHWVSYFLKLDLPDQIVSRYSDTSPMDVVWEVYDICVNRNNPEKIKEVLYVAGRGSGKTLGMAVAEFAIVLHNKRDVVHVGAVMAQAKRCYAYIKKFMNNEKVKKVLSPSKNTHYERIIQAENMEKSVFNIDSEECTLEVLPCTMKACNGPHVPLIVVDEIDTVSGEGFTAFQEIAGMLDSKGSQQALRVGISTRKSTYGLMHAQIENAHKEGRHVRQWTAFEFHSACPDTMSGTKPLDLYINQDKMHTIEENAWKQLEPVKQKEYIKYKMLEGCKKCPLASICMTDAKKQKCKSFMLKPIEDLIQKVRSQSIDWVLAQLMNLKPSIEGVIYREFDPKIHALDWNQMWEKLTGIPFPTQCTHDIFIKKCHELGLQCYAGIDWGWAAPSTVVFFFVDNRETIYVVKSDGMSYVSQPEWIHYIKTKYHRKYRCQMYFPDIADGGAVLELKKSGLPVTDKIDKSIMPGVQVIKKFLRVPGQEEPKMFIAQETNSQLISEFQMYHFKTDSAGQTTDVPEEKNDHWLDALRYPMMSLFGKNCVIVSSGALDGNHNPISDNNGNYFRTPTPEEFARQQGLVINTDIDVSKSGKIGTLSDFLKEDEEEDSVSGGGGFLWSI